MRQVLPLRIAVPGSLPRPLDMYPAAPLAVRPTLSMSCIMSIEANYVLNRIKSTVRSMFNWRSKSRVKVCRFVLLACCT